MTSQRLSNTEDVISAGILGSRPAPVIFSCTRRVTGFAHAREVAGGPVSSAGDVVSAIAYV